MVSRELRAVWVATVFRLDFPSRTDLTPTEARAEISAIVDTSAKAGLNAIFFQVRPESDTFYESPLEPWSRFASGTQGIAPGYDPLALFLELAHAKGLEVHAWMNPYRAQTTSGTPTHALHVTNRFPKAAIAYNGGVTMDPADTQVALHKLGTAAEWSPAEIETEVALTRGASGTAGQTWFRYTYLKNDTLGITTSFDTFYKHPARPPIIPAAASQTVGPPSIAIEPGIVALDHPAPSTLSGYAVYQWTGESFAFSRWALVGTAPVALQAGRDAISAIGRGGARAWAFRC